MKNLFFFILFVCLSHTVLISQNLDHLTIDKVQVSYKAVPSGTASAVANGRPDIKVLPQATIVLKTTGNAVKLYLKMSDPQNNSVLYQVNYLINAAAVTDANGIKLFYKEGNTIHIGSPGIISLNPYKYEVYTEDGQGNSTTVFSVIQ